MIPYAVDAPFDRRPVANWAILGVIVLVFALGVLTTEEQVSEKPTVVSGDGLSELKLERGERTAKLVKEKKELTGPMTLLVLDGWRPLGIFGYNWLHANIIHLVLNVVFLWVFGNAVCSKIGNKVYPVVYLGFCLLGALVHLLVSDEPAFGASVAISGIVGMYAVIFAENAVSCFFLFPHPVTFSVSGYFVIVVWFVADILVAGFGIESTSYVGHSLGLGGGFGLAVLMLKKEWVVMEKDEKSLLQVFKREKEEEPEGEKPKVVEQKKAEAPVKEKAVAEEPAKKVKEPGDGFIRFYCECGKRIKVPAERGGQTGRCPKCKALVRVPEK